MPCECAAHHQTRWSQCLLSLCVSIRSGGSLLAGRWSGGGGGDGGEGGVMRGRQRQIFVCEELCSAKAYHGS